MEPVEMTAELWTGGNIFRAGGVDMHPVLYFFIHDLFPLLLAYLLGYSTTRRIQRGEWERQRAEKEHDSVKLLINLTFSVETEITKNHDYLLKLNSETERSPATSLRLSTLCFEPLWRVFVESALSRKCGAELHSIKVLYYEYEQINRHCDMLANLDPIAITNARQVEQNPVWVTLKRHVPKVLHGDAKRDAEKAVSKIQQVLKAQEEKVEKELKCLQRRWWKFWA